MHSIYDPANSSIQRKSAMADNVIDKWFGADHPVAADLLQRWRRYRALVNAGCTFGLTDAGMFMIQDLRASTDRAKAELEDADLSWEEAGCPTWGRRARRFRKARLNLLKAMTYEKEECEGTLLQSPGFVGPADDEQMDSLLRGLESEYGLS
jgi:hypothetical protein